MTCEGAAADVLTQIRPVRHSLLKAAGALLGHQQRRDRRLLGAVAATEALLDEPGGPAGRRRRDGLSIMAGMFSRKWDSTTQQLRTGRVLLNPRFRSRRRSEGSEIGRRRRN